MPSEKAMAKAIHEWLNRPKGLAAREISVGRNRFDVVAYDKRRMVFKVVECKMTKRQTSIGKTFGQLISYHGTLTQRGYDFVNAASKKLGRMSFNTWMEATNRGRHIFVEFYVALTNEACKDFRFLQSVKEKVPDFGIIRYRGDGKVRRSIWVNSERDYNLPKARVHKIRLKDHSTGFHR